MTRENSDDHRAAEDRTNGNRANESRGKENRAGESPLGTFAALAGVIDASQRMMRNEAALLRAEASHALGETQRALISLVIAAVLAMVGLNVLAGAGVAGLTELGLSPFVSALIVGGIFVLVALGFASSAKARLKGENLAPRRTGESLKRNLDAVQAALKQEGDGRE